jgi:hypothetical protein
MHAEAREDNLGGRSWSVQSLLFESRAGGIIIIHFHRQNSSLCSRNLTIGADLKTLPKPFTVPAGRVFVPDWEIYGR